MPCTGSPLTIKTAHRLAQKPDVQVQQTKFLHNEGA